jgi:hypothetical protein
VGNGFDIVEATQRLHDSGGDLCVILRHGIIVSLDRNSDCPKANFYCLGDPPFHLNETPTRNRFHKIMMRYLIGGKNYDFFVFRFVMPLTFSSGVAAEAGVKTFQTGGVLGRLR